MPATGGRTNVCLIVGGRFHDFDFARLELLKLLHAHDRIRVRVAEDYSDIAAIAAADALVSYTCDVRPTEAQQAALATFIHSGRRWFALHGTNSFIDWQDGRVATPRAAPRFMQLLGSQFIAHPPMGEFRVEVTEPSHALVRGIAPFTVNDELYLSELHGTNHVLLHTHFNGKAQKGFAEREWYSDEPRPVLYLHSHGEGQVLYCTLGHCRGRFDMQPYVDEYPTVERCSWESPVYYEILARGIRWVARLES
ncbi:MAG TPA: ThuA domain-containing protein [Steroidobacteraceae bacterium]|nr:ThuA domain-containing protein [Steroidobacteraceae bacterium]